MTQVVILGCTEFGMLLEAGDNPVPLIETTLAHAEAAVEIAPAGVSRAWGRAMYRVTAGALDWDRAGDVRRMHGYSATRRREHDRRPLSDPLAATRS